MEVAQAGTALPNGSSVEGRTGPGQQLAVEPAHALARTITSSAGRQLAALEGVTNHIISDIAAQRRLTAQLVVGSW